MLRPFRTFSSGFLDDVLVFLHNSDTHVQRMDQVLHCLPQHGLVLQLRKCHWFVHQVEFIGFFENDKGVTTVTNMI